MIIKININEDIAANTKKTCGANSRRNPVAGYGQPYGAAPRRG
jgi:hypothetical protein